MTALSIDFAGVVSSLDAPLDAASVGAALLTALADRYEAEHPAAALYEFEQAGAHYLFDLASSAGLPHEDRTVAAWAVTPTEVARRDTAYQRGFPMAPGDDGLPVDRGHVIPHLSGGMFGPNIFRQDRALNRGWSEQGKRYRALEREAATVPGTLYVVHLMYKDDSAYPSELETALLRGTALHVERFDNRPKPIDAALLRVRSTRTAFVTQPDALGRLLVLLHAAFRHETDLGRDVFFSWRTREELRTAFERVLSGDLLFTPRGVAALADVIEPRLVRTRRETRPALANRIARAVFEAAVLAVERRVEDSPPASLSRAASSAAQWVADDHPLRVRQTVGSTMQITYGGRIRNLPLRSGVLPSGPNVSSPAGLLRARSRVVPYTARGGVVAELVAWTQRDDAFALHVLGGRGGSGKTRVGVELCEQATATGWLAGMLEPFVDQRALESLVDVPSARLVVVDYAETRGEQIELVLPLLAASATPEHPVRVLLLMRAEQRDRNVIALLRNRSYALDALLDESEQLLLEDLPLDQGDREALFAAAANALAERTTPSRPVPLPPSLLEQEAFSNPLLVVIAAYLAVHGDRQTLRARAELLEELLAHEDRYWQRRAEGLATDSILRRRVVALATLAGAATETEAAELLALLPDLHDASTERRHSLARWAGALYPGTEFWNPLEPDLLADHLVVTTYRDQPDILAAALARVSPHAVVRPLDLLSRAAREDSKLAALLAPILSARVRGLCELAVEQAATQNHQHLLLTDASLADALNRAIAVIPVDPDSVSAAVASVPPHPDVILGPLALTLTLLHTEHMRRCAATDPATYEPQLAMSLDNLTVRLAAVGRRGESLDAIEESATLRRRLAQTNPAAYAPDLAMSLNTLSVRLAEVGRRDESLVAIQEAVSVHRRLAAANPAAFHPALAMSLNNLSVRLAEAGRYDEGLAAIEEATSVHRRLAATDPAAYEATVASSLNSLSARLSDAGRRDESLTAIEEAVGVHRRLVAANPAAYAPDLAMSLNNLSVRLAEVGRRDESLVAIQEAVSLHRRLAAATPAAYERQLASSLNNLSESLASTGRHEEGLAAIEEAVTVHRRLAAASPAAHEPALAISLNNLSLRLADVGRREEGLVAIEEATNVRRRLAVANPAGYARDLATSLTNLALDLAHTGRHHEGVATIQEAVTLLRGLAVAYPGGHEPDLAMSLTNLSGLLADAGRSEEALVAIEEAVNSWRRLSATNPAHRANLGASLEMLSSRLDDVGRRDHAAEARAEASRVLEPA